MQLKLEANIPPFMKKPGFQLAAAAIAGSVLITFYMVLLIIPQQVESRSIEKELNAALARSQTAEQLPIPVAVTDEEVLALQRQVPLRQESAGMLKLIQEHAAQTGVQLISLTFGEVEADKQAQLEDLISRASEIEAAESAGATLMPMGTGSSSQDSAKAAGETTTLQSHTIQLEVQGSYRQAMEFLNRFSNQERILRITDWSLNQYAGGAGDLQVEAQTGETEAAGSFSAQEDRVPVSLRLTAMAFTAPQYIGKLKEPPALQASPGAQRADPTWNDAMMWELLKKDNGGTGE